MIGPDNTASQPPPSSPANPSPLIFLNVPISTKLNRQNFLAWQSQIVPVLHGYGLYTYVTGPQPYHNPQQDQILLGWLRSSLSESMLGQSVSCTTSSELWANLHSTFSATSRARQAELRRKLLNTTKKGINCTDYLMTMRSIADELAFIGSPVSNEDLAMHILGGLGPEFNSFVVATTTSSRNDSLSLAQIQEHLLSHENLLQTQTSTTSSLPSVSDPLALYTSNQKPKNYNPKPNKQPYPNQYINNQRPAYNPNPRPRGPRPIGPRPTYR